MSQPQHLECDTPDCIHSKAENNHRWLNFTVKAFGDMCERVKRMKLKEGSYINIIARYDEETWETKDTHETRTGVVLYLDEIEYASSGNGQKNGQASSGGTAPPRAATHLLRRMALRQLRTSSRRVIRKASRPPRDSRRPIPCPEVLPGMKASAIPAIPSFNRLPVGPNEYQAYKAHSSWKHIRGLCAFFALFGGDALRNQAFQARTETGKRRKLEVVLRQLTRDHLTDQQRQLISQTVGCCQQYSFQLCYEPGAPALTANGDSQAAVYRIFGDTAKGPTAVLVRTPGQGEMSNTIYIYLPTQREEKGDDTRQEETSAQ